LIESCLPFDIIRRILLPWIILSFLISSEIHHHYLGINADLKTKTLYFNDKIEITSDGDWEFKLNHKAQNVEVLIDDKIRKLEIKSSSKNCNVFNVPKFFWEPNSIILEVNYQLIINKSEDENRFNSNELYLFNHTIFFPTANENYANFDLYLQSPDNWKIITPGNFDSINKFNKNNLHKFSTDSKISTLNIFGFPKSKIIVQHKNPVINLINIGSVNYDSNQLSALIKASLDTYGEKLIPYKNDEFSVIISSSDYFTSSKVMILDTAFVNPILENNTLLDALLFPQWISDYSQHNNYDELKLALLVFINEYAPRNLKNQSITQKLRKDILSSFTLNQNIINSLLPYYSELSSINPDITDISIEKVYNYLFILFMIESLSENNNLSASIKTFFNYQKTIPVKPEDFFLGLGKDLPFDSSIIIEEWNRALAKDLKPKLLLQVLKDKVKLVQQGYVRPLLVPAKFQFSDGSTIDSVITTRSYSHTLYTPAIDSKITKISIDPEFRILREFTDTELSPRLKDIHLFPNVQIVMNKKLSPFLTIAKSMQSMFIRSQVDFITHDEIDTSIPAVHIGYLPDDYTFLATETDIILEGRKYYSKSHALVYVYLNSKNIPNVILYSKNSEELGFIINKLKHFGKYGYIIFRHGNNALKGVHQTNHSHLVWER